PGPTNKSGRSFVPNNTPRFSVQSASEVNENSKSIFVSSSRIFIASISSQFVPDELLCPAATVKLIVSSTTGSPSSLNDESLLDHSLLDDSFSSDELLLFDELSLSEQPRTAIANIAITKGIKIFCFNICLPPIKLFNHTVR